MASRSLLALCAVLLVSACGGDPSPLLGEPLRPGADRQVPASDRLPPAAASPAYGAMAAPADETRTERVGAHVSAQGGQKVQREKAEKEHAAFLADRARQRAAESTEAPVAQ